MALRTGAPILRFASRSILVRALQDNGFNRTATAARLGISLRQIRYRIDRLGIDLPAEGSKHQSDNV